MLELFISPMASIADFCATTKIFAEGEYGIQTNISNISTPPTFAFYSLFAVGEYLVVSQRDAKFPQSSAKPIAKGYKYL